MRRKLGFLAILIIASAGIALSIVRSRPTALVLTGIVTTNEVIVGPQIGGQVAQLLVKEGDAVKRDQLLAIIAPDELKEERAYYAHSAAGVSSQVRESEAALRFQERQTVDQIRQAAATLAATEAQQAEAGANLENARLMLDRTRALTEQRVASAQELDQAKTAYETAISRVESLKKQIDAQRAALALARANAEQIAMRRSQLQANQQQQAAARAQSAKADVRLAYTEIKAPIDGIIDVRAVRPGEVVNPGQAIVSIINPDDLWVRADVEETYIDRLRVGDRMTVRLPSGDEREGTIIYRGIDASFATERDVSRTKRDIKTFEVRLRVDNRDRHLAVGMTAYVLLPIG